MLNVGVGWVTVPSGSNSHLLQVVNPIVMRAVITCSSAFGFEVMREICPVSLRNKFNYHRCMKSDLLEIQDPDDADVKEHMKSIIPELLDRQKGVRFICRPSPVSS
jgi:hypothetical protein